MTQRCTLSAHSVHGLLVSMEGQGLRTLSYAHRCGRQPGACSGDAGRLGLCRPLLRMAQLLTQLGADATAVHPSFSCLLAIAVSAGEPGMWDLLGRDAPALAAGLAARCHAGRVLICATDRVP